MSPTLALTLVTLACPIGVVGIGGKPGDNVRPNPNTPPPASITALVVAPDGKTALSGSAKGELRRYALVEALAWAPAGTLGGSVSVICFAPDGVAFAADDAGAIVRVPKASPAAGQATLFATHAGGVRSLALTPAGDCLLSGGVDGVVRLWDLADGAQLSEFDAHGGLPVTGLAFADGRLWSVGWDRTLRGWKLSIPKPKKSRPRCAKLKVKVEAGSREATSVAACGERLLSASWDGSLRVWDLKRSKAVPHELSQRTYQECVSGLVVSPDGRRALAVAAAEGGLVVIDRLGAEPVHTLRKRLPIPSCAGFAGDRVVVGNFDGTVVWGDLPPAPAEKEAK